MESTFIWVITLVICALIFIPAFIRFRKNVNKARFKREESIRLGADKTIAQHPQIDPFKCIGCGACVDACPEGEVLGIVGGKATIINGLKCVGHGKCAEACPVEGITIGLGDISERDDLPALNTHYETNLPGIFIAGELGGLALIKNAISQGNTIVEYIAANKASTNSTEYDLVIIGAGPAGLSAALSARKHNLNYLLLDQQDAGGTILHYPRKKLVMTRPVEIPLYGVLRKPEYSKEELREIWQESRTKYELNLKIKEKLQQVKTLETGYQVITSGGSYSCKQVILALGRRGTPRKLNIPGEEKSKVMYKLIDAELYQNEHILIVGGGDSAIEAAMGVARQSGNTVTLSYRKDKFFRIKARNQKRLDDLINQGKIEVIFNSQPIEIGDTEVVLQCGQEQRTLQNDYVFIFAGGEPPFKLLKEIGIHFGSAQV